MGFSHLENFIERNIVKLKLTKDGHAVVRDGKPVYVHTDGREEAFDAPVAWRLALGEHFKNSPVMAGLKLPADVAASFFGDSFRIDGGKLMAVDKHGIQLYSPTRHGEAADFNEAFAQLVDGYEKKGMIQREPSTAAPGPTQGQQDGVGTFITRDQFDSLPPASRAKYMAGGRTHCRYGQRGQASRSSTTTARQHHSRRLRCPGAARPCIALQSGRQGSRLTTSKRRHAPHGERIQTTAVPHRKASP